MADWRAVGLNCITVNLQCRAAVPSDIPISHGTTPTLGRTAVSTHTYMRRLDRVLAEVDALGMVVIVGLFYFGQFHRYRSDDAVRTAMAGRQRLPQRSPGTRQQSGHCAGAMGLWELARVRARTPELMDSAGQYEFQGRIRLVGRASTGLCPPAWQWRVRSPAHRRDGSPDPKFTSIPGTANPLQRGRPLRI